MKGRSARFDAGLVVLVLGVVRMDGQTHSASISVDTMSAALLDPGISLTFQKTTSRVSDVPLRTKSALLMPSFIFSSSRRPALAMKALCRRGRKNW